jgi:hypothetical protein
MGKDLEKIYSFIDSKDYEGIVKYLEAMIDKEERKEICKVALTILGMQKAMEEYGSVRIIGNKEEYEKAKMGLSDCSPNNILYVKDLNEDSSVEGIEEMIDFVPEDNPIKMYYRDITEE